MADVGYRRDASAYPNPNVNSSAKVHRESAPGSEVAACMGELLVMERPITTEPGDPIRCGHCYPRRAAGASTKGDES